MEEVTTIGNPRSAFCRLTIEMTNPPVHELPQEILDQLDAQLFQLYSQLSPDLRSKIDGLIRRALLLPIHSHRLVKYAFLRATAEIQARGEEVSKDHAARSRLELEGAMHAFPTGYGDNAEAQERYRRGRQARQYVGAAFDGLLSKWKRVEQVVQKHRSNLPVHQQPRVSNERLAQVNNLLHAMSRATIFDDEYVRIEDDPEWPTWTAQTYIWWWSAMAPYRGKWSDMHRLALAWRLSDAASVETFRNLVGRIRKRAKSRPYPFPEAWESILSKKA